MPTSALADLDTADPPNHEHDEAARTSNAERGPPASGQRPGNRGSHPRQPEETRPLDPGPQGGNELAKPSGGKTTARADILDALEAVAIETAGAAFSWQGGRLRAARENLQYTGAGG